MKQFNQKSVSVLNNFRIKVFDKILFQLTTLLSSVSSNFCLFVFVSTKKYPVKNYGVSEQTADSDCRQDSEILIRITELDQSLPEIHLTHEI